MNHRFFFDYSDPNNQLEGGLSLDVDTGWYIVEVFEAAGGETPIGLKPLPQPNMINQFGTVYRYHLSNEKHIDFPELVNPMTNPNFNQRWRSEGETEPKVYHKWSMGATAGKVYLSNKPGMQTIKYYENGMQPGQNIGGFKLFPAEPYFVNAIAPYPTHPNPSEENYVYCHKYSRNIEIIIGWDNAGADSKPHWFNTGQ